MAKQGDGWLAGRWVARQGDGWLGREMGGYRQGDGWLNREVGC
jgi:hypothetical protein